MHKSRAFSAKKLGFLLIPILIGIVYWGSAASSTSTNKDKGTVKINNLTRSCELLNVEKHTDHLKLSVHNLSNKAITAFVLTSWVDPQTIFTFKGEFAFSEGDDVIHPGQSYDLTMAIPVSFNHRTEITLNLSALIFEDKSNEGDPKTIQDIEDNRLGQKIQLMKALSLLDKLLPLSETEVYVYWNKTAKQDLETALNASNAPLLTQLSKKTLNNKEPNDESEQFNLGVQAGKESVIQKYQELKEVQEKQGTNALRQDIVKLRSQYAKIIARL
jgi:hypothetical protein